jgi:hypothetical protein
MLNTHLDRVLVLLLSAYGTTLSGGQTSTSTNLAQGNTGRNLATGNVAALLFVKGQKHTCALKTPASVVLLIGSHVLSDKNRE